MASDDAPVPPSSSSSAGDSFIGSFISLISRFEIRYEGVLYFLDVKDSTIGLKNVKAYGTEGRKKEGPQVPPRDAVYDYILFRGCDIKDLQITSPPPAKAEEQLHNDPAIIQTQYKGAPFSSPPVAVGGKNQLHFQDTPAVTSRVVPGETHPYQSGVQLSSAHQTQSHQSLAATHFSTPISSQSYNGTVISPIDGIRQSVPPLDHPSVLGPGTVQNQFQLSEPRSAATSLQTSIAEGINPTPSSVASSPVHSTPLSSQAPKQLFNSPAIPFSPANLPLSPDSPLIPFNNVAMPPMINSQAVPDHSVAYPAASFGRPTSGPLLTPPPSVLAPNRSAQPVQKFYPNNDMGTGMPLPAQGGAFSSISRQTPTEPLLPLPTSALQKNTSAPFTEEFDFEAMNEKFRKDEVWGALGKLDNKDEPETEESYIGQSSGGRESDGLTVKPNTTPAYKKDDFFDTISCRSLSQGTRTGQNRFSERMKTDSETFGNFDGFRPANPNYGVYGAGRGQNYHGQYNWGRGYGHGGRGNGRNTF